MQPGSVLANRFVLEQRAGSGGMGTVWRAHDRETGATVAIKVLQTRDASDFVRFQREAELLSILAHPAICRWVANGVMPESGPYLAMEWIEGEDLAARLSRGALPVAESLALARRVLDALATAHVKNVIHRDLKPGNIFLPDGRVEEAKLLDFGVARLRGAMQPLTATGTVLGTPGYMAPEQARGCRDVDARADIFSFGCVLFECLTGRPAFVGAHVMALLAKVLLEDPPPVCQLAGHVPPALGDLVARMLEKDPAERPGSAAAVAEALAGVSPDGHAGPPALVSVASITATERRVICVALAGCEVGIESAATISSLDSAAARGSLEATVTTLGGRLHLLADGSVLVVVDEDCAATDQAIRAARCALAMRERLPGVPIAVALGRAEATQRLPVGEVVDRAAALAKRVPDAPVVRVDAELARLLDGRFDIARDGAGDYLSGERQEPDTVRKVLGKPTPFVGRDRELGQLADLFDECIAEPVARAVLVTAPPGMGKSRLRAEFQQRLAVGRGPVESWTARGDPMSAGSPFGLLAQTVCNAVGIRHGDPDDVDRHRFVERVGRLVPEADRKRIVEFLGELVLVQFPDADSVQLRAARQDAVLMGDQIRRAWEDFLSAELGSHPVLIVLEDLHWGDLPTVAMVDRVLRNLHDRPLFVLALARPEVHAQFPSLWAERTVQEIRLGPLTRRASERLVREVLGTGADPAMVGRLVERAEGNPFCIEELVRAVVEGHGDDLPDTVLALVEARLARLESEARRVLRAASVFGETFWRGGVAAVVGFAGAAVDARLDELVARELVQRKTTERFPDEHEYAFGHGLVRDAAYGMFTAADQSVAHRLAGTWLEDVGEKDAIVLAEHLERGQQFARAAAWWKQAAQEALEGNDLDAVAVRAERGMTCATANGAAVDEQIGSFCLLRGEARSWQGRFAEASVHASDAVRLLHPGTTSWYSAVRFAIDAHARLEHATIVEHLVAQLLGCTPEPHASSSRLVAVARALRSTLVEGPTHLAEALAEPLTAACGDLLSREPLLWAEIQQARQHRTYWRGLPNSIRTDLETIRAYDAAGDLRNACHARHNLGCSHVEMGLYREAEAYLRQALAESERMGLTGITAMATCNLGLTVAYMGRFREGESLERSAIDMFARQETRGMETAARAYLALVLVMAGDVRLAEREARVAVDVVAAASPMRSEALFALGHALLAAGRPGEALQHLAQSLAFTTAAAGMLGETESGARLDYAEALQATGQVAKAREAIRTARARLLERGAAIEAPEHRRSFLTNVPENARTLQLAKEWLDG